VADAAAEPGAASAPTGEPEAATGEVLSAAKGLGAGYRGHPIVPDLNLHVRAGEVVALLGPNGAGKTTTLLTLAGDIPAIHGEIELFGRPTKSPLHRRASRGLALVTEERSVFMGLSTRDNLRVGGVSSGDATAVFNELEPLLRRRAGLLSGGEQQMLTLARALARQPRLLLADELSLGLAPLVVRRLLETVRHAADERGVGVLLVEQHVKQALRVADRVYVLRRGRVVLEGTASEIGDRIEDAYLASESEMLVDGTATTD
jgi:branched-chain amino acid transport system ATP-binding protein